MWKVFIADDSALFRREMIDTFPWAELGCRVVGQAENGEDAERQIRALRPQLVITDICMPCRDGLDMIQALSDLRDVEYIIVSAYSKFEYAMRVIKLQAYDYLLKPIDDGELLDTIRRVIVRMEERGRRSELPERDGGESLSGHVEKLVRYIQDNYERDITLGDVAKALFISESYVSKLCRRELNTGFSDYVKFVRIQRARELLESPHALVYEVAAQTGFSDHKYFCTVFKRYVGTTPKQYQIACQNRGKNP